MAVSILTKFVLPSDELKLMHTPMTISLSNYINSLLTLFISKTKSSLIKTITKVKEQYPEKNRDKKDICL
jgi:hypothetical protein